VAEAPHPEGGCQIFGVLSVEIQKRQGTAALQNAGARFVGLAIFSQLLRDTNSGFVPCRKPMRNGIEKEAHAKGAKAAKEQELGF
jgi:hypothetical protein